MTNQNLIALALPIACEDKKTADLLHKIALSQGNYQRTIYLKRKLELHLLDVFNRDLEILEENQDEKLK